MFVFLSYSYTLYQFMRAKLLLIVQPIYTVCWHTLTPKGSEILGYTRGCYAVLGQHVVLRPLPKLTMPCRSIGCTIM